MEVNKAEVTANPNHSEILAPLENEANKLSRQETADGFAVDQKLLTEEEKTQPVVIDEKISQAAAERAKELAIDSTRGGGLPHKEAVAALEAIMNGKDFDPNALTQQLIKKSEAEMQSPEHQN